MSRGINHFGQNVDNRIGIATIDEAVSDGSSEFCVHADHDPAWASCGKAETLN